MGKCIFCGSRANSKEDAWPKWLVKLLKTWPEENVPIDASRYGKWTGRWHGVNAGIRVKNVCRTECNSGWMSELEQRAVPILTPMIEGTPTTLDSVQQLTISTWVAKCAMIFDSMDRSEVFYDDLDRAHVREHLTPIDSTSVWLASYSGASLRAFTEHGTYRSKGQSGRLYKFHIHTMAFGRLALQIVSIKWLTHKHGPVSIQIKMVPGPWEQATVQIWPLSLRPVQWPPSTSFDDSQCKFQTFVKRFLAGNL